MAKDPLLPDPPQSGDSWESLAGNLFGIDLNSSNESDLLSDEELEALEVAPPEPPTVEVPEMVEEVVAFEEPAEPPVAEAPVETAPAEKKPDSEEDAFWDPLASWEWDDDDAGAKAATREAAESISEDADDAEVEESEIVKGPGTDARRASETFETVSDYRTEYDAADSDDEWSFGAGLLADVPAPEPKKPEKRKEKPEKPERAESRKREPRKRRDEDRKESPEPREPSRSKPRPEKKKPAAASADSGVDDFAAGLIDGPAREKESSSPDEPPREKRSRRGGRRRRRPESQDDAPAKSKEEKVDVEVDDDASDSSDFGAGLDSEAGTEKSERKSKTRSEKKKSPYRNIPTWETAISYMLKNSPSGSDKSESSDGDGKSDRPRRRRRRRRPRSEAGIMIIGQNDIPYPVTCAGVWNAFAEIRFG